MSVSKDEKDMNDFGMLKTAKYAGIDDLGTEPVNVKNWGTDTSPVIDVIYRRYNSMKTTVLSTNLNMEMIRKTYGERIFDRICEQYSRISFNFQSFRQA
jgi:DNA replication protein DnaC